MHIGVLGPLELHHDGPTVPLGRRKQRALLAALVAARGATVSLDRLVDLLWDEEPPPQAIASLQAYVSNLRRLIEPERAPRASATRLVSRSPGYALLLEPDELDATRFAVLLDAARAARDDGALDRAVRLLDEAHALWRGNAFAEFADEPFVLAEASRLEELRLTASEERLDARLALGRHGDVVADAESFVAEHPLRERAWGSLMVALYRSGRQADALRAFQRARQVLREELGLEPGPDLRALEAAVLAHAPELERDADSRTPATTPAAVPPTPASPADPDALLGRDDELARLTVLADRARAGAGSVVVVTGEAGVGKSALADAAVAAVGADTAVATGRSPETRDAPALWPWLQVLRRLGVTGPVGDDGAPDDTLAPAARRAWVVERIVAAAADRPVVIIIDDVQWADGPTHHVLRMLADEVAGNRILLIVTRRIPADGEDPALVETMAHLARTPGTARIDLSPLRADDGVELVRRVAGAVPDDIAAQMHARAGGNPFFVVELARLVAAEGSDASTTVPSTVRDVIRQRLARLPEQAVAVITIAAVLGSEIEPPLIADISQLDVDEVHDLLELGVVVGLLTDDGGWRFAHDLARTSIERTLTSVRLARLHAAAVTALVARYPNDGARVHAIARHALGAVPATGPGPAVEHLIASGRSAQMALDLTTALEQYQRAAELTDAAPDGDPTIPARFALVRAQLEFLIGGRTASVEHGFRTARAALAGEGGEYEVAAALAWGSYSALWGELATTAEQAGTLRAITGAAAGAATSAADYLDAYVALTGDVEHARRALEDSITPDAFAVGAAIRRGLLAVLDVLVGDSDAARANAAEAVRIAVEPRRTWTGRSPRGAAPDSGPWVAAWAGSLAAVVTCLVADSGDEVRPVVAAARAAGGGIRISDLILDACASLADALDGDAAAVDHVAASRQALTDAGDGLFGIPLAIAELRGRSCTRLPTEDLDAEIAARIDASGQFAWRRLVEERPSPAAVAAASPTAG